MFTLEPGDTGEAILAPHSDRDGSRSEAEKVNDRSAFDPSLPDRHALLRSLTNEQRHLMLCYIMGYNPEVYDQALHYQLR